jgi:hypothetical protein
MLCYALDMISYSPNYMHLIRKRKKVVQRRWLQIATQFLNYTVYYYLRNEKHGLL